MRRWLRRLIARLWPDNWIDAPEGWVNQGMIRFEDGSLHNFDWGAFCRACDQDDCDACRKGRACAEHGYHENYPYSPPAPK